MEEVVNDVSGPGAAECAAVAEIHESETYSVVEAASGRELLWYPVGIFVVVLGGRLACSCSARVAGQAELDEQGAAAAGAARGTTASQGRGPRQPVAPWRAHLRQLGEGVNP